MTSPADGAVDATATPTDPGKQRRVASHIPVVAAFDGYRAYAILGIVVLHLLGYSGVLTVAGSNWFAHLIQGTLNQFVDILFIISGFVVFLPTVARHGEFGSVSSYSVRRATRLLPAYWAVLVILVLLAGFVTVDPPIPSPNPISVGLSATFLQMFVGIFHSFGAGFEANPALWTLSLEIAFYLLLPLIASWYFRRPLVGLLAAAAITVVWREALAHWPTSALESVAGSFLFPFFAFSFGAGMTGAWAYVRLRERYRPGQLAGHVGRVQIVSLISLLVCCYFLGNHTIGEGGLAARNSTIVAIGFTASLTTLMVATALGPLRWQRPFAHPFVRQLGDISYGIFLIHVPITIYAIRLLFTHPVRDVGLFQVVEADGSFGSFVALAALVLPLSIVYGYLSARFLEQPIRRWAQRFGRRRQEPLRHPTRVPTGS